MEDVHGLICQSVCFDNSVVKDHLHDESTLCLASSILYAHLATVDGAASSRGIKQTGFEDSEQGFRIHATCKSAIRATRTGNEIVVRKKSLSVQSYNSIRRFRRIQRCKCKLNGIGKFTNPFICKAVDLPSLGEPRWLRCR